MKNLIKSKWFWSYVVLIVLYVIVTYLLEGCYQLSPGEKGMCGLLFSTLNFPAVAMWGTVDFILRMIGIYVIGVSLYLPLSYFLEIIYTIVGWSVLGFIVGWVFYKVKNHKSVPSQEKKDNFVKKHWKLILVLLLVVVVWRLLVHAF